MTVTRVCLFILYPQRLSIIIREAHIYNKNAVKIDVFVWAKRVYIIPYSTRIIIYIPLQYLKCRIRAHIPSAITTSAILGIRWLINMPFIAGLIWHWIEMASLQNIYIPKKKKKKIRRHKKHSFKYTYMSGIYVAQWEQYNFLCCCRPPAKTIFRTMWSSIWILIAFGYYTGIKKAQKWLEI